MKDKKNLKCDCNPCPEKKDSDCGPNMDQVSETSKKRRCHSTDSKECENPYYNEKHYEFGMEAQLNPFDLTNTLDRNK